MKKSLLLALTLIPALAFCAGMDDASTTSDASELMIEISFMNFAAACHPDAEDFMTLHSLPKEKRKEDYEKALGAAQQAWDASRRLLYDLAFSEKIRKGGRPAHAQKVEQIFQAIDTDKKPEVAAQKFLAVFQTPTS